MTTTAIIDSALDSDGPSCETTFMVALVAILCVTLAIYWLCPEFEHHQPHVPHPHVEEVLIPTVSLQADGGSSGTPIDPPPLPDMSWMGNSLDVAARVASRNHQAAYSRMSRVAMSTGMNVG